MKALSAGFFAAGLLTGTWWVAGIGGVAFVVWRLETGWPKHSSLDDQLLTITDDRSVVGDGQFSFLPLDSVYFA